MTAIKAAFLVLCQLFCLAFAVDPTVDLIYSRYIGVPTSRNVTQWLGLRYAAPPVANLRFMPPQDPPFNRTTTRADKRGKICLATGASPSDTATSEDCLFIDVFAPTNATVFSKLPVYFFIHGGGFNANSNSQMNGTALIEASGHSIIVVTFGYRVGPYGFITNGDKITPNNGLRDQRKALQWVKRHIYKFGGDPNHIVIGGDSAGAASVSLQMVAYEGRNTGLFHAAAAESVSFATVLTVQESQYLYNNFTERLGCTGTDSLSCLRSKTAAELQAKNSGMPYPGMDAPPLYTWNPVIDHDLITDYTYNLFAEGKFVKVPVIYGDDTNGGTTFTPRDASTLAQGEAFLRRQFPYLTSEHLDEISSMYPNPNNSSCPGSGCYWRQVSDVYGDMRYMCPTLYISSAMTRHGMGRSYSYRYNVEDPQQMQQGLGVPHTIEIHAIWGPGNAGGGAPASYYANGVNAAIVPVIQAYWTSFIRSFDPNKYKHPDSAVWGTWSDEKQNRLLFDTGGKTSMETVDDDTQYRCNYLTGIGVDIRQ
ncbi:alpha/beta-hydrolase [Durotheca rogersii]|uniref:alpha/beta-hydrolase n=1 Tax=Durotheca rogersii TaxID=419775 RepID=UPI00221F863B|nr:alpha/beta-hydrolase [Durotheca rogersii]KAI5863807.1 alpha/beta-hydrolase [Durotheca rogersii]